MTLEEAIIHCKEKACDNTQCAMEHRQLAGWLEELQKYRKNKDTIMEWVKEGKEHYRKLMEDFPDETSFAASFGVYNGFIEKLNSL